MDLRTRIDELATRAGLSGVRRNVAVAVAAVLALAVAWTLARGGRTGGGEEVSYEGAVSAEAAASSVTSAVAPAVETTSTVWVHVVGAVRVPDIYELPAGSRAGDAIRAAGGLLGNAAQEGVNLARLVVDGEQVRVPTQDEWDAAGGADVGGGSSSGVAAGGSEGASGALVDLNTADLTALDTLPGVGPATAARIVQDREENGPFASVDDLARVSGIGPKKLEALRDLACVR
ncbi:MAG: ComEA family DNA-binding protein [Actinomycetota bacterium]|nr:ComEA family DNA-binding protein [Actinomycetota bacterium]